MIYKQIKHLVTLGVLFGADVARAATGVDDNTGGAGVLSNPLGNKNLTQFLQDLLDVIMVFAIPLIVFMIIYAGFNYVMAQGSPEKVKTANKALLYAVIGGVIILGAQAILTVVQGTVDAFK